MLSLIQPYHDEPPMVDLTVGSIPSFIPSFREGLEKQILKGTKARESMRRSRAKKKAAGL